MQVGERHAIVGQVDAEVLMTNWASLGIDPAFELLRGPETGLVSLRGRIGGGGAAFPFGDATATRATVRLVDGRVGHSMLLGRDHNRATIAAVIDALCRDENDAQLIDTKLMPQLADAVERRDKIRAAQTAATKVDFFTMVRGED